MCLIQLWLMPFGIPVLLIIIKHFRCYMDNFCWIRTESRNRHAKGPVQIWLTRPKLSVKYMSPMPQPGGPGFKSRSTQLGFNSRFIPIILILQPRASTQGIELMSSPETSFSTRLFLSKKIQCSPTLDGGVNCDFCPTFTTLLGNLSYTWTKVFKPISASKV